MSIFANTDLMHSAYVAASAAGLSYLYAGNQPVVIRGFQVPSSLGSGAVVGVANWLVQELNARYPLVNDLPISQAFKDDVGMAVVPAATGLASHLSANYIFGVSSGFMPNFAIGAAAELTGQYVGDKMNKSTSQRV
jgi:hypothetical protein